jgi:hypothetical protein
LIIANATTPREQDEFSSSLSDLVGREEFVEDGRR